MAHRCALENRDGYNRRMRILSLLFATLLTFCSLSGCGADRPEAGTENGVERAFERHESNVQVMGEGVVTRLLADDTSGLPHQRFIVRIPSGKTVLIEYNTDVAPRIADLKAGDRVSFAGEYIWNDQGGLVHWTHHDPAGRHQPGWIKHGEKTYQ